MKSEDGGLGLKIRGSRTQVLTNLKTLVGAKMREDKSVKHKRFCHLQGTKCIMSHLPSANQNDKNFWAGEHGERLRKCHISVLAEKVSKGSEGEHIIQKATKDGYVNVFIKDDILERLNECQRRGLLMPNQTALSILNELYFREWVDHGALNGISTYVVCWTLLTCSPCFKPNLTPKERAFIRQKFVIQVVPARPTKEMHNLYSAKRLPLIKELIDDIKLSAGAPFAPRQISVRLRLMISDTKALDPELGKKQGGKNRCPQCEALAGQFGKFSESCACAERTLLIAIRHYLAGLEADNPNREVDGYTGLPALVSECSEKELREAAYPPCRCDSTSCPSRLPHDHRWSPCPSGLKPLAIFGLERAEIGLEPLHGIWEQGRQLAKLTHKQLPKPMQKLMDHNIATMVLLSGLGECKESNIRDLYSIWDLIFGGLGLTSEHIELIICFVDMMVLTYSTEHDVTNVLHYYVQMYKYNRLVERVFDLGPIVENEKEKFRRQHFHSWLHRAEEYRRGSLFDTVAQAEVWPVFFLVMA